MLQRNAIHIFRRDEKYEWKMEVEIVFELLDNSVCYGLMASGRVYGSDESEIEWKMSICTE